MTGSLSRLRKKMPQWLNILAVHDQVDKEVTIFEELYYDEDARFGAYVCKEDNRAYFVIRGLFPYRLKSGMQVHIVGKVALYKEEKQIKVESLRTARALDLPAMIFLLQSLDGLDKRAYVLAEQYGEQVLHMLKEQPATVAAEIAGISLRQAEAWSQQLKQLGGHAELLARLQSWGISLNGAKKLVTELGAEVDKLVEQNPYLLCKRVRGFGFRRCDEIAQQLGLDMRSRTRQLAAISYVLREASYDGHCFMERVLLLDRLKATLELTRPIQIVFSKAELEDLLTQYVENGRLVEEQGRIYLPSLYKAELKVAAQMLRMLLHPVLPFADAEEAIKSYAAQKGLQLEHKQLEAVRQFSQQSGGVYILNGSAGCGKTFTLNIILDVLEQQYQKAGLPFEVRLFAPTGKAAKVASKATGRPCTTIHRGLSYSPERGYEYNEENKMTVDCVVIDESSMLDITLASHLFSALPQHCKVILLGDTKQLPSVGAGNVLHDLIASEAIPVVTLDVVKRQGKESGIIANAASIIAGKLFAAEAATGDAFIIEQSDAERMQAMMLRSIARLIETRGYSLEEIQVLCPQRRGEAGTHVVNWLIQQAFNRNKDSLKVENCKFTKRVTAWQAIDQRSDASHDVDQRKRATDRTLELRGDGGTNEGVEEQLTLYFVAGDKVIHTVNNYGKLWYSKDESGAYVANNQLLGITNGECGVIEEIYTEETGDGKQPVVVVCYEDGYVKYKESLDELDHCYAMTVHKSQGSQWKAVIMIVMQEHAHMLNNSIFYTGYTRAQQFVCVIGQHRAIKQAIANFRHTKRNSSLRERFIGELD